MIHSVPMCVPSAACENSAARPRPSLRPYVLGYGAFRSGDGRPLAHRLLPVGFVTLVIDPETGPLVTGAWERATVDGPTVWGAGVTIGLNPAGVPALLAGVSMSELAGRTVPLGDLLGDRAAELTERLAAARDGAARFAVLDRLLRPDQRHRPDRITTVAWQRLHHRGVAEVAAELGVTRRRLERTLREQLGLSPGAIRRIARFQRAVEQLGRGVPPAEVAADNGYADQPHLTRETRSLAAVTPGELRAIVQYRPLPVA